MPSIPQNPLIRVAEVAARELDAAAAARDFAKHFSGMAREAAAKLWGGSALLLKNGEYVVVPVEEPVSTEGGAVQVVVRESGTFAGRRLLRGAAWFKENVVAVWLGALSVEGEGDGAQAVISAGFDGETRIEFKQTDGVFRFEQLT